MPQNPWLDEANIAAYAVNQYLELMQQNFQNMQDAVQRTNTAIEQAVKSAKMDPFAPIITKTDMKRVVGLVIVKDEEPSPEQNEDTRAILKIAARSGLMTHWRGLLNEIEVNTHLKLSASDPDNLPAFGRSLNIRYGADTIDNRHFAIKDDGRFKAYLDGLKTLGAEFLTVNDANQYRAIENGKPVYPAGTLERMVERIRKYSDLPLLGSLTISANPAEYAMFDHLEGQCFGKIGELPGYLKKSGFRAFCLDTQSSASPDYLAKANDILVSSGVSNVWLYAGKDRKTDWRKMLSKVAIIESGLYRWRRTWAV